MAESNAITAIFSVFTTNVYVLNFISASYLPGVIVLCINHR